MAKKLEHDLSTFPVIVLKRIFIRKLSLFLARVVETVTVSGHAPRCRDLSRGFGE